MQTENTDPKAIPSLFVSALKQFSKLMQDEVALAKAEISQNVSRAGVGLAMIGIGAILALVAFNTLAAALVTFIASLGLGAGTAALIVGGGLIIIAAAFVLVGKSRLSADALAPTRAAENIKRDADAIKEAAHVG
ncbi:phage holin family protein [Pseudaestuariivita rosea]|uniref:phage holin family protein n=1 Tax=Pseudaestuariivita rosea TaxID=2763263 RepID=UPI001ABA721C|nr:phage holin family protein [Pseudaestuariivita rosea]